MLPIAILVSEYIQNQIDTLNNQTSYNSKLISATYDAVKVFQINTVGNTTSDISGSKIRDIEASANAFLDSISNSFGLRGNNTKAVNNYIPAIVYTLYDGYYIYSPYTNNLGDGNSDNTYNGSIEIKSGSTYSNGDTIYSTKPYIYYTCRYQPSGDNDFVITYTLDNYITIQGTVGGKYINTSGYLLDDVDVTGVNVTDYYNETGVQYEELQKLDYLKLNVKYKGVSISNETLEEYVLDESGLNQNTKKPNKYKFIKVNGTKYYYNPDGKEGEKIFFLLNNKRMYNPPSTLTVDQCISAIENNTSAKQYYVNAWAFTSWVRSIQSLNGLQSNDSEDDYEIGNPSYRIFKQDSGSNPVSIEAPNSEFNAERLAVIRKSIEKNLTIAIANYNNYSSSTNEFMMPKFNEEEWTRVINNVSVISFLQGLPIGGKVYNGYAIVENNKNQEVVSEDSIYITSADDQFYHKITDSDLVTKNTTNFLRII